MKTELKETNKLIAERQSPGDRWSLVGIHDATIYESLTDALNAYFNTKSKTLNEAEILRNLPKQLILKSKKSQGRDLYFTKDTNYYSVK